MFTDDRWSFSELGTQSIVEVDHRFTIVWIKIKKAACEMVKNIFLFLRFAAILFCRPCFKWAHTDGHVLTSRSFKFQPEYASCSDKSIFQQARWFHLRRSCAPVLTLSPWTVQLTNDISPSFSLPLPHSKWFNHSKSVSTKGGEHEVCDGISGGPASSDEIALPPSVLSFSLTLFFFYSSIPLLIKRKHSISYMSAAPGCLSTPAALVRATEDLPLLGFCFSRGLNLPPLPVQRVYACVSTCNSF